MTLLQLRLLILLELLFAAVGIHAGLMLLDWDKVPVEEVRAMRHGVHYIGVIESRAWFVNGFLIACVVVTVLFGVTRFADVRQAPLSVKLHWLVAVLPLAYLVTPYNAV